MSGLDAPAVGPASWKLAVLVASHNRRDTTLRCLEALAAQTGVPADMHLKTYLLDDGSTDGTVEAIRGRFPAVRILLGDGQCFWAGGMRRAWDAAALEGADAYLWLNDDTCLDPDVLTRLCRLFVDLDLKAFPGILVGTTRDPISGLPTYGGNRRLNPWRPFWLELVTPGTGLLPCDTFNGNCVLVPQRVVERIGRFDGAFLHGMADTDYGFRARRQGIPIWVIPGTVGACSRNESGVPWEKPGLSLAARWRAISSPKGLPPSGWVRLSLRHGGWLGPFAALWPYLKLLRYLFRR